MTFEERIEKMLGYVQLKISERDWHGAIDGLMDIRDLEAEQKGFELGKKRPEFMGLKVETDSKLSENHFRFGETIFQIDDKGVLHPLSEVGRKVDATLPGGATETYYYGEYPGGDILNHGDLPNSGAHPK